MNDSSAQKKSIWSLKVNLKFSKSKEKEGHVPWYPYSPSKILHMMPSQGLCMDSSPCLGCSSCSSLLHSCPVLTTIFEIRQPLSSFFCWFFFLFTCDIACHIWEMIFFPQHWGNGAPELCHNERNSPYCLHKIEERGCLFDFLLYTSLIHTRNPIVLYVDI